MKQQYEFSKDDLEAFRFEENRDTLMLLMKEFKDFYHQSKFHKFYQAHQEFYERIAQPMRERLAKTNIINILEEHYGQENAAYYIVPAPLLHDGGYGPQIKTKMGEVMYAIIGPMGDSKGIPKFDIENLLSEYVIHEFSHSFCNPLINNYLKELEKDSCLLEPINASQEEQGYGRWASCLYEHLVRANEIKLTEKVYGKEKADEVYNRMVKEEKWIYLEGLIPIINTYLANRQKYKTEEDIMPLVVQYFHEEASKCK